MTTLREEWQAANPGLKPIVLPDEWEGVPDGFDLIGIESNAGTVMGAVSEALKAAGNPRSVVNAWRTEAMSGDFDHLLRAALVYSGKDLC